jgi:hypothetical protein
MGASAFVRIVRGQRSVNSRFGEIIHVSHTRARNEKALPHVLLNLQCNQIPQDRSILLRHFKSPGFSSFAGWRSFLSKSTGWKAS